VGEKKANAWGLHDVYGNVSEWCADWFDKDYYKGSPLKDPTGPATPDPKGSNRVVRGGDWGGVAGYCLSAYRRDYEPGARYSYVGFRACLVLPDKLGELTEPPVATPQERPASTAAPAANAPFPAVAPFDAAKAKQHQEAWAKHLNVPVEETNSIGMKLAFIPPGEFEMGSMDEDIARTLEEDKPKNPTEERDNLNQEIPRHRVKITKPFYLGMYQVTQAEYEKVMGVNPSGFTEKQVDTSTFKPPLSETEVKYRADDRKKVLGKDTSRRPVETVNWDEAMEFCRRLSAMPAERAARHAYRLPTEAEWEYACRAGTTTRWYCGDDEKGLFDVAWFNWNADGMTHPVGEKKPNAWGLYDMHGNVYQWCSDRSGADYYKQSPLSDPSGPTAGYLRVFRGGAWSRPRSAGRSAFRYSFYPDTRAHSIGFRVAVEVVANEQQQPTTPAATAYGPNAPPPAVAPFDAAQAKEHQEAWAKRLNVPVEQTNSIGMKLALIPPGEFDMGFTEEEVAWALKEGKQQIPTAKDYFEHVPTEAPRHHVKLTKAFCLGMYPVTQAEYEKVMGVNPSDFTGKQVDVSTFKSPLDERQKKTREENGKKVAGQDTSRHPVEMVSWDDCVEFCRRLSAMPAERAARRTYRLPTEAEWEYACRAGTTTRWYCGDDEAGLLDVAWILKNAGGMTHPVGQKKPNAWGLYDMHGQVYHWCADKFSRDYYQHSPLSDPTGPTDDTFRVIRGGYWGTNPLICRSARRIASATNSRVRNGFRVVCQVVASSNQITTFHDAAFQQWMQSVAALPAKKQVEAVSRKLVELNPGFDGKLTGFEGKGGPKIDSGAVTELAFDTNNVTDVSPVRALAGLRSLGCRGSFLKGRLSDLSPLRGSQLAKLDCMDNVALSDLSPLAGMPLVYLSCHGTRLSDLSPLRGMPLTSLDCGYSPLSDLSSLKGMRLTFLSVNRTPVSDLSPLEGMPLTSLNCNSCGRIVNLSPLRGMPLTRLDICGSRVTDLSPLEGMPLV
jgi:formylglycine-generating enzyme required for sulfatase activity